MTPWRQNLSIALLTVCDPVQWHKRVYIIYHSGGDINSIGVQNPTQSYGGEGLESPTPTDEGRYKIHFIGIL